MTIQQEREKVLQLRKKFKEGDYIVSEWTYGRCIGKLKKFSMRPISVWTAHYALNAHNQFYGIGNKETLGVNTNQFRYATQDEIDFLESYLKESLNKN